MISFLYNQKWKHSSAFTINTHNCCSLFTIPRLNCLASATSIGTCNYHSRADYAHHKPSLVKVVEIAILYPVFCSYISYELKLLSNKHRIFA